MILSPPILPSTETSVLIKSTVYNENRSPENRDGESLVPVLHFTAGIVESNSRTCEESGRVSPHEVRGLGE